MGCTTSMILFDGLHSVLQRNCVYWKSTSAAEPNEPVETEAACASYRESRVWPVRTTSSKNSLCMYESLLSEFAGIDQERMEEEQLFLTTVPS
ncbi:dedicator of cytokinesis protein 9 isoform X1 [Tachysurus ichikawai]